MNVTKFTPTAQATLSLLVAGALLGATLGRLHTIVRSARAGTEPAAEYLRLPEGKRLVMVFQPGDCANLTEPITRALLALSGKTTHSTVGFMLDAPTDAGLVEKIAANGGIPFPVIFGSDTRPQQMLRRLGFFRTPVVLALNEDGELRFARSGTLSPEDIRFLAKVLNE